MRKIFFFFIFFQLISEGFTQDKAYTLRKEYLGENLSDFELEKQNLSPAKRGVHYFSDEELLKYKVKFENGLIIDPTTNTPFNSYTNMPSIYVLTEKNEMYISKFFKENLIQHSSLSQGKPIKAAGQCIIINGLPIAFDNQSGHYRPDSSSFDVLKNFLIQNKIDISKVEFSFKAVENNISKLRINCSDFLK